MKHTSEIQQEKIDAVNELLSIMFTTQLTLYTKTRKFYRSTSGTGYLDLHGLLRGQYKQLGKSMDEINNYIGNFNGEIPGTKHTGKELPAMKHSGQHLSSMELIGELLRDHETAIIQLRKSVDDCAEKYGDANTADFFNDLMEEHLTFSWALIGGYLYKTPTLKEIPVPSKPLSEYSF